MIIVYDIKPNKWGTWCGFVFQIIFILQVNTYSELNVGGFKISFTLSDLMSTENV